MATPIAGTLAKPIVVEGRVGNREILVPIHGTVNKLIAATVYESHEWDTEKLAHAVADAINRFLAEGK